MPIPMSHHFQRIAGLGPKGRHLNRLTEQAAELENQPIALRGVLMERLEDVLAAAATVPAYQTLWSQEQLSDPVSHFLHHQLPRSSKDFLRQPIQKTLSSQGGRERLQVMYTSGTTGEMTRIVRPDSAASARAAIDRRLYARLQLPNHFTMTIITPWRCPITESGGFRDCRVRMRQIGFQDLASSQTELQHLGSFITSPEIYLSLAPLLGRYAKSICTWELSPQVHKGLRPTYPQTPHRPDAEIYAAAEIMSSIAVRYPECDFMHINADAAVLEIVDPDTGQPVPEGTPGRIVITDLLNTAMPIIRYEIRDIGLMVPATLICPCGRATPRVIVLGRSNPALTGEGALSVSESENSVRADAITIYDSWWRQRTTIDLVANATPISINLDSRYPLNRHQWQFIDTRNLLQAARLLRAS